ncbi:MAG TPA: hypothetical protein VGN80_00505 [Devosiaceae bacterium]|jgi:predicted secreted Zn-dependent protease|nr:hypothetical protein [Devosiaceae bacterium]
MFRTAIIAALATVIAFPAAAETIIHIDLGYDFWSMEEETAISVGDPFLPPEAETHPRVACLAVGGTPVNQIQDNGSIGIRCLPVAQ